MKKRLVWAVIALLALTVVVLLVARFRSSSLPATYRGLTLPTPVPGGGPRVPTAWRRLRAEGGSLGSAREEEREPRARTATRRRKIPRRLGDPAATSGPILSRRNPEAPSPCDRPADS